MIVYCQYCRQAASDLKKERRCFFDGAAENRTVPF